MKKYGWLFLVLLLIPSITWAVDFEFDWPQTNADGSNLADLAGAKVYVCPASPCTKANGVKTGPDIVAPTADPAAGAIGSFSLFTGAGFVAVTAFDTSFNESAASNTVPFDAAAPSVPVLRKK